MYKMSRTQCVLWLVVLYLTLAHSWDIAVSHGDLLDFYTNETKTETVRVNSHNPAALAYDDVHNMLLYVDKQTDNDAICGHDISSKVNQCFTERNGRNIHGISYDPGTAKLFFSDTNERSINWFSLKSGSNKYGNLLIKLDHGIPTDIAVDSCRGFVYWINTNLTTPTIERARFNGYDREVVININSISVNTTYNMEPHSLIIDQLTQKIYWIEPSISPKYNIFDADFNGSNKRGLYTVSFAGSTYKNPTSNTLTISKKSLFWVDGCSVCEINVWKLPKTPLTNPDIKDFNLHARSATVSIAANYKIQDKIQETTDCKALASLVQNNSDGPFCVHGMKVIGQSFCKCAPGYIGERCDVTVCENYCFEGNCSVNYEGLPKCRCNAGYSGDRCEVDACHGYCSNNGDCSLNEKNEPVCQCKGGHTGVRCECSDCLNYCIHGNCSVNEGLPECSCDIGYTGDRCEVNVCQGYCLNNGVCSLTEEDEPFCECEGSYEGIRCEAVPNDTCTTDLVLA